MPKVNRETLGSFPIIIPPKVEQVQIVQMLKKKLEQLDFSEQRIGDAIAKLKEYRTALITNAVTGKIDVRNVKLPELDSLEAT